MILPDPDGAATERAVALTFDDLPGVVRGGLPALRECTDRLLAHLAGIPAAGFVNECGIEVAGEERERTALLQQWISAGAEIGNHTYSHLSLHQVRVEAFWDDVMRGERITRRLLADAGRVPRYFRHPYLQAGRNPQVRARVEASLAAHGYRVAPVTMNNRDWVYGAAYGRAREAGDGALMARLRADYVRHMGEAFGFYERLSRDLCGREPAQVVVLHANLLNADCLGDLIVALRTRGYRFVSLDEALDDPEYAREDGYVGPGGLSWIERWMIGAGRPLTPPPTESEWVRRASGISA